MKNPPTLRKGLPLNLLCYFLFLAALIFGAYIRFEDIKFWGKNEALFFYKGEPLYSEYDSFYFARLVKDMEEGIYQPNKIDPFRFFPDNSSSAKLSEKENFAIRYPLSGAIISHFFYYISKFTGLSLPKLTWYLIPLLAVSLAFPLFFYLKRLNLPLAGVTGSIIATSSPMYLGRTTLMRLDHDIFNLTLPFLIGFLFYLFFQGKTFRQRLVYLGLASGTLLLYQLWYAHANLSFLLVVTFLFYFFWQKRFQLKVSKSEWLMLGILILPQIWYLYAGPAYLYFQVKTLVFGLKEQTSGDRLFADFPNIFQSISELQTLSLYEVFKTATYSLVFGVLGLIGAILLFLLHLRALIFILPFFVIGLLTFFSGARFAMYLAPFIGLGLGFLVHLVYEKLLPASGLFSEEKKRNLALFVTGLVLFLALIFSSKGAILATSTPKIHSLLVKDMEWIKVNTPKEAVIWTWWDYGYAFQLYARRATIHDGGCQATPKTYLVAQSFATHEPEQAWRIISFTSNHGLTGLAKLLKEGKKAQEIMEGIREGQYAKPITTPIYVVFTDDLIPKFGWIHYFGSYDFTKKEGTFGQIVTPQNCQAISPTSFQCADLDNAVIDLTSGIINIKNGTVPIKDFFYHDGQKLQTKHFFDNGYVVELIRTKDGKVGLFLLPPSQELTIFNRMFILRDYDPRYFELVYDNFPTSVIYKVKSE